MKVFYDQYLIGEDYQRLIEVASKKCNRFAFVQRRDMMADEELAMGYFYELVKDIEDSLIEMKEQSEWETTELLESTASVFYYELNEATKIFLLESSNSLFGWMTMLPEDLMLYKDDEVWFAGCSHERWFAIREEVNDFDEVIELLKA